MKTLIGALVGIAIIVLIVVVTRSGHKESDISNTMDTQNNSQTEGTVTQSNGLRITTVKIGTGVGAVAGDEVTVNYTGSLENGTVFDSNVDPKFKHVQPFSFMLGSNMVIQGWEQGVLGMKVGEKRHLVIPAELGYGAGGAAGGLIPANAVLEFDVEVTNIKHK
jgi:FKBP-type peptidyl-prolyl cis-trans isomerase